MMIQLLMMSYLCWILTLEGRLHPNVDFKMSGFIPKLCNWLHAAWMKVGEMQSMIVEGRVGKFRGFKILM
jgi:hypothetical protein